MPKIDRIGDEQKTVIAQLETDGISADVIDRLLVSSDARKALIAVAEEIDQDGRDED